MGSANVWELRGTDLRTALDADQAELNAVKFGSSNLEAGIRDERIAGAMDDFDVRDPLHVPDWAETDSQFDNGTSAIGDEILRRVKLMGDAYPFELTGNKIVHKKSKTLVYEFCLAVSQTSSLTKGEYVRLPRAFERLSRDIIQCFLGPGSTGYRTGWPADDFEERPVRFRNVIEMLSKATGEWRWDPLAGHPQDPEPRDSKDEGLDFVVWKSFSDSRKGQLFVLGQCACGNDWTTKYGDLDLDRLGDWIRPISDAPTIRAFAVPFHISNIERFSQANRKAGLTIDRMRIAMTAERPENCPLILSAMKDDYKELIKLVIPSFN